MRSMQEVNVRPIDLEQLAVILPADRAERLVAAAERARSAFGDRVVWHVNATAHGGGVAEMLQTLLAYGKGAGIENRWLVLDGDSRFFAITKRLHNMLHGEPGDGGSLGPAEHAHYEAVLRANLADLVRRVSPRDIVLLHDPQTAGLAAGLRTVGPRVVWRCHVGRDLTNDLTDGGLGVPASVPRARTCTGVLAAGVRTGVGRGRPPGRHPSLHRPAGGQEHAAFTRGRHGGPGTGRAGDGGWWSRETGGVLAAGRHARHGAAPCPLRGAPHGRRPAPARRTARGAGEQVGPTQGHGGRDGGVRARGLRRRPGRGASGARRARGLRRGRRPRGGRGAGGVPGGVEHLPDPVRGRVHLASIPMDDVDENAIIVNALQRHATVVVQKSLVEGFGLTVTEAMWKGRAVVASKVGGIQDQITDGRDGLLVEDPYDIEEFARVLQRPLDGAGLADRLGAAAHARVLEEFLGDRHLEQYVDLFTRLVGDSDSE